MSANLTNPILWQRIKDSRIAPDSRGMTLEKRVEMNAGLSPERAQQSVEEFRRFLYLSEISAPYAPPPLIELVWNEHNQMRLGHAFPGVVDRISVELKATDFNSKSSPASGRRLYQKEFGQTTDHYVWGGGLCGVSFGTRAALILLFVIAAVLLIGSSVWVWFGAATLLVWQVWLFADWSFRGSVAGGGGGVAG